LSKTHKKKKHLFFFFLFPQSLAMGSTASPMAKHVLDKIASMGRGARSSVGGSEDLSIFEGNASSKSAGGGVSIELPHSSRGSGSAGAHPPDNSNHRRSVSLDEFLGDPSGRQQQQQQQQQQQKSATGKQSKGADNLILF
jgi:hypothetical protein